MIGRRELFAAFLTCFCLGALTDWWGREKVRAKPAQTDAAQASGPPATVQPAPRDVEDQPVATSGPGSGDAIVALRRHEVVVPIDGVDPESFKGGFAERRGDSRPHEAVDILAPRNTPVRAVEGGSVAKLFDSKAGGHTIYQFDPSGRFCYYYAHLERYANGLAEGQHVSRGEVIGYVGTSGNAPRDTPHLHFAVFDLTGDRHWWEGRALDPYPIFKR